MADVKVTWSKDTNPNIASYAISFAVTPNNTTTANPPLTLTVPRDPTSDTNGYTALYSQLTPAPPALNNGDSIAVTGTDTDTFGQASPPVTATGSPVVIGAAPPPPPTGPVNLMASAV